MKNSLLLALVAVFFISISVSAAQQEVSVTKNLTSVPLAFTENQGQWNEKVMFRADAGSATMWFASDGACYQFVRRIPRDKPSGAPQLAVGSGRFNREPDSIETLTIKALFVAANANAQVAGEGLLEYKCNYFIGNDPTQWRTDVATYSAVVYREIYPGIDLKYYGNGKEMEYDFIVSPGADPSQIMVEYDGAESVRINGEGELVVETQWGEVIERRPVVYQSVNGTRVPIEGRYEITGNDSFGFSVGGDYDPTLALVIDPVLSYSTYLGGNSADYGYGIAVDASGAVYVAGYTYSADFPTQTPIQGSLNGNNDVFVTKLSADGSSLIYSTYLGGSENEYAEGLFVDATGAVHVTGETWSTDFPTESGYQEVHQGGDTDAFVTKLSADGSSLVYSTYLGGSGNDYGFGIAVDVDGATYVAGYTLSTDFPTENGYQQTHQGGEYDSYVTKLNPSGNSLVYSTYLGGGNNEFGYAIAVDASGAAYVTGDTWSTDFPTETGYQQTHQGGDTDAFVTKLSAGGNTLVYSTYLGGSSSDGSRGIVLEGTGAVYVTGFTGSTDFPTESWYQETNQGEYDVFVTKMSAGGDSLVYSTYLGGGSFDRGEGIAVDAVGAAYVTGSTNSSDFPTESGYQETNQGKYDAFVTKLCAGGDSLVYSTYLGGKDPDWGEGIAVDAIRAIYVTGRTWSTDFPTESAYQETHEGSSYEAFITKLAEPPCCQLRGDLDASVQVDILDIDYFIDWLFRDGIEPDCLEEANVDANEQSDILDVDYLVDYMFRDGPDPVPCP